jgi:membrane protein DedA with SNARE-associated domain
LEWFNDIIGIAMGALNQSNLAALTALFFVVALTEIGIPFPYILDTVLFLTSYENGLLSGQVPIIFGTVFLGRQFGAAVLYWLTRGLGAAFLIWLGKRYPSLPENLDKLQDKVRKDTTMAIAITRLTGLLTLASVTAGTLGLRYRYLFLGVTISSAIFDGALLVLGFLIERYFSLLGFKPSPWAIAIGVIVVTSLVWIIYRLISRRRATKMK